MASWFSGLSSSLGCYLGQMSHSAVSFTRQISRRTKNVWMTEYKMEESNELRRKEVETTKETVRPKVERFMTFYSDLDLENKQKTAAYNDLAIKKDLHIKLFTGKEILETQKLQNLQEDTQSVNAAAGLISAMSSTSLGENFDPKASEYQHELKQKNLEMMILTERHEAMYQKLLKLQKTTQRLNAATGLVPAMPVLTSLGDNIEHKASEYKNELEQQNLEMKIMRGRNVAMKHKLLKLQKAIQCLNAAVDLLPARSSASLGENINPNVSEYEHELEQKNLEVKILRGRNVAMKYKLLKLRKATECLKAATGLKPAIPVSTSLGNNIDHNASEYKNQLKQQNLEMEILRGRNVAMKHKLFKLQKATECLNAAAGLLPAMSSASVGENINTNASECGQELEQKNMEVKILIGRNVAMKHKLLKLRKATECLNVAASLLPVMSSASQSENIDTNVFEYEHELQQKNLEVKILRGRNVAMKHNLLKLRKATQCLNGAAGLVPAMPVLTSLGNNIDPNVFEYEHQLEQKNLEVKILRGRNVAMKHKLLKLQKATQCLNAAAGLLPATSSASLSENIDPNPSEYKHELGQKNLEMKILSRRNAAMKHKLLKLQKATQCLNEAAGLLPAMSSASLDENIDPNPSEYKHELGQKNLEMKILSRRNAAMKHKLLKLQKATQYLNAAAGLLPAMSSASLGENLDTNVSEYEHELEQKNLEVKILRGRNVAMKHKLLKLRKVTQCLKAATGLKPAIPVSTSLGNNIDSNVFEYEHQLEQKNLEVKILRGRNVAMKHKLLKLQKATQCLNAAAGLLPATSSASLSENINPNPSEYKHELGQKNLEMKILRRRNVAMKHKLLKLQKATQCMNAAAGLLPAMTSASTGENMDPNVSEYEHELEQKNLEVKILRGRNVEMKHKLLKLQKATDCLNAAAGLLPAMTSASLGENMDTNVSEYEHELEKKNLEVKILRGRNVAMKHKLLKLQKATQCLNSAAGLVPDMPALTSLGDNIHHNAPEYKNQLKQQNLEMKILRGRNVAMKHKLLKLQKAIQCLSVAAGLLPAMSSASLGENIDPNASEYEHQLEQKNLEMKILRERHTAMNRKLLKLHNASQSINVPVGLIPATPASTSLGDNSDPNASEYEQHLQLKSIDHHTSSTYQHLQNRLTRWIWSKVFPTYCGTNAACHT